MFCSQRLRKPSTDDRAGKENSTCVPTMGPICAGATPNVATRDGTRLTTGLTCNAAFLTATAL